MFRSAQGEVDFTFKYSVCIQLFSSSQENESLHQSSFRLIY